LSDHGGEPEEDQSQFKSSWAVEWKDEEKNTVETKEENEYPRALTLFNELSGSGKDVVLYELRTLVANTSAQPRKIPVLNSMKGKSREAPADKKPRPRKREATNRTTRPSASTKSSSLKDLRTRIFILIAVIATFVIILFLISILFTGSDIAHFLSVYSLSHDQFNLVCDYACIA
jgi:hypothetical protein